jgi:hypothetical protein
MAHRAAIAARWAAPLQAVGPGKALDFPVMKLASRSTRLLVALCAALAMLLVAAPAALAENGVGLAGPVTDKEITFFCFGVIGFFALLVIVLSLIQAKLEKRKETRRYDLDRFS